MYPRRRFRQSQLPSGIKITRFTDGVSVGLGSRCQIDHSEMISKRDAIKLAKRWAEPNISTALIIACRDGRVITINTDRDGKVVVTESIEKALPKIIANENTNEFPLSRRKARKLAHVYRGSSRGARYVEYLSGERTDFYVSNNRLVKVER